MKIDIGTTRRPILIAGPTASGKSGLALQLAERYDGIVINADALQVYDGWRILTARPDDTEQSRAPHRLYGHVPMGADYSVGHWLRDIKDVIQDTDEAHLKPIIVGGTGLYFQALTQGLVDIPPVPDHIRAEAEALIATKGLTAFADDLRTADPDTYARIDTNNPARTQRAWEVLRATGRGISEWQADTPPPLVPLDSAVALNLVSDTGWLNDRIDRRFDQMINMGALNECRAVMTSGWDPAHPSCQAIGAKELIAALQGQMDLQAAIEAAKTQTRQYAKRQRTWFRNKMRDWTQVPIPLENGVVFEP